MHIISATAEPCWNTDPGATDPEEPYICLGYIPPMVALRLKNHTMCYEESDKTQMGVKGKPMFIVPLEFSYCLKPVI